MGAVDMEAEEEEEVRRVVCARSLQPLISLQGTAAAATPTKTVTTPALAPCSGDSSLVRPPPYFSFVVIDSLPVLVLSEASSSTPSLLAVRHKFLIPGACNVKKSQCRAIQM
jgi:hypothetical protein